MNCLALKLYTFIFQLAVCPKSACLSTVGVRSDLFKRDPNKVPITDFFGSVRPVVFTTDPIEILDIPKRRRKSDEYVPQIVVWTVIIYVSTRGSIDTKINNHYKIRCHVSSRQINSAPWVNSTLSSSTADITAFRFWRLLLKIQAHETYQLYVPGWPGYSAVVVPLRCMRFRALVALQLLRWACRLPPGAGLVRPVIWYILFFLLRNKHS